MLYSYMSNLKAKTMNYTKGEWILFAISQSGDQMDITTKDGSFELYGDQTMVSVFGRTPSEVAGNAKLISKAPEMYELIKECKQHLMDLRGYDEINDLLNEIES